MGIVMPRACGTRVSMMRPMVGQGTPLAISRSATSMTGGIWRTNVKTSKAEQGRREGFANDVAVEESEHVGRVARAAAWSWRLHGRLQRARASFGTDAHDTTGFWRAPRGRVTTGPSAALGRRRRSGDRVLPPRRRRAGTAAARYRPAHRQPRRCPALTPVGHPPRRPGCLAATPGRVEGSRRSRLQGRRPAVKTRRGVGRGGKGA